MKKQKGLALVLAALMLLSCVGAAAEEAAGSLMGSKKAAPTELTEDNRETTVTLSLPSEEYKNKVDVVFVMDNSTSTKNSNIDFSEQVQTLLDAVVEKNPDIELKVGIIKFRGYATDMLGTGLTLYDESSSGAINAAVANNTVPGSGSNAHSGLRMAEELLSKDSEVEDDHKYVILLTDGKNYIWNNEDDEPVAIHAQYLSRLTVQKSGTPTLNQTAGSYNKEQGDGFNVYKSFPSSTLSPDGIMLYNTTNNDTTSEYYEWLFNNDNSALTNGTYDFPAFYTDFYQGKTKEASPSDATVTKYPIANANEAFTGSNAGGWKSMYGNYYQVTIPSDSQWAGLKYPSLAPYEVIDNGDGTYSYDLTKPNEDFFLFQPTTLEKGLYVTGHYWADVIAKKYNTASVTFYAASGGIHIAGSFIEWLHENSDYSAKVSETDDVIAMFDSIDNSISYLVAKGTVTDQIKDDFTLKESDAPFTVTVSGKALAVTKTGDSSWVFGDSLPVEEGPVYPYEISYDASTKTITWNINVPVEIANPVTLSYDLVLREDAESGTYDTNEYAILDYESTDGEKGTFTFPIPQVTYTKPEPTVKPTATPKPVPPANEFRMFFYKEWPDGEPTDIFFTLYQPNGSVYKHAFKKTKVSGTKFLYEAWLSNDAEYFVIETAMAGYNTAYKNTGAHADVTDRCFKGGTIINTKIPVTGDSMTSLWVLLALVSAGAIALLARKKT